METYKAELWKLRVCDSVLAMTHGFYKEIKEIYIPEEHISINSVDGILHCFVTDPSRYEDSNSKPEKLGEFEIDGETVQATIEYLESKKLLEQWISECVIEGGTYDGVTPQTLLSKKHKFE